MVGYVILALNRWLIAWYTSKCQFAGIHVRNRQIEFNTTFSSFAVVHCTLVDGSARFFPPEFMWISCLNAAVIDVHQVVNKSPCGDDAKKVIKHLVNHNRFAVLVASFVLPMNTRFFNRDTIFGSQWEIKKKSSAIRTQIGQNIDNNDE